VVTRATRGAELPVGRRARTIDVTVACLVTVFVVLASANIAPERDARALDALGYGIVVAAGASLVFARRYPWPVVGFLGVALVGYLLRDYPGGPVFGTVLVGLFWLGVQARRRDEFVAAGEVSRSRWWALVCWREHFRTEQ
jgi:hypothetical protein